MHIYIYISIYTYMRLLITKVFLSRCAQVRIKSIDLYVYSSLSRPRRPPLRRLGLKTETGVYS